VSVVIDVRGRNCGTVDSVDVQEGVVLTIHRFVWGHVDSISVASVRICHNFSEEGEPIGLAEVGHVSQGSLELPDLPFSLPLGLVMARRGHNVSDPYRLKCLLQELRDESWVSITDHRGRDSMRRKNRVSEYICSLYCRCSNRCWDQPAESHCSIHYYQDRILALQFGKQTHKINSITRKYHGGEREGLSITSW